MDSAQKITKVISVLQSNCFSNKNETEVENGCERVFDGLYCWPKSKPGSLGLQPCTNEYIKSINKTGFATRQCTENGTWFLKEEQPWTNLSQCGGIYIFDEFSIISNETIEIYEKWLPIIKDAVYIGYAVSIITLIMCLVIFINIKRLHCDRNKLHIHLFLSFILRACMFILKDSLFIKGTAMFKDTTYGNGQIQFNYTWICKAFITTWYYFILSNFTFMLMEGLYLHNLIFLNLLSESHGTLIYRTLGWVLPCLFIIPWFVLRLLYEDALCWTTKYQKFISLLLDVPIGITVIANFMLFVIIIRVLILKIHYTSTFIQHKKIKYMKLIKSTLILIPLYGMPYTISLFLSFFISKSKILEIVWLFFDQTFTSYQGLFAALVYCLLNTEVQNEIKRKYSSLVDQTNNKEFRRSRTISSNTQQFSLQTNDDALENLNLFGIVDNDTIKNSHKFITSDDC